MLLGEPQRGKMILKDIGSLLAGNITPTWRNVKHITIILLYVNSVAFRSVADDSMDLIFSANSNVWVYRLHWAEK
jgi:hypothetical protein